MKPNQTKLKRCSGMFLMFSLVFLAVSCKDYMEGKTFLTSDDRMIDEYIMESDPEMSTFLGLADKAGFRGILHAYGTNTCFVPTNQAIERYCADNGMVSLESLSELELENFMKFHIVRDTIKSAEFVDGRLITATMLGKFLTTKTVQEGEFEPIIEVNRQAYILKADIRVANGIIHKIDYVLTPNRKTVGEMVELLPDNYSLFKEIMLETKLTDTLKINSVWYTVFLQSNESFATRGILNRDSLIKVMKIAQPDYADDESKLIELYARYHILKRLAYVTDLSMTSAELSMAPNQVITFKNVLDSLILNEYESLTTFEKGVNVGKTSEWTDRSCFNGVMIDLEGYIQPVKRGPAAIYWELTEQPEVKKLKEYRKMGSWFTFYPGDLSELAFGGKDGTYITYNVSATFTDRDQYVHYDHFDIPARPTMLQWMEIKTPVLTEGVYNIWVCWRRGGEGNKVKFTFKQEGKEDQILPNVFDMGEYFNDKATTEVNLNNGMKQYNAKQRISTSCSRLCGAIKVEYTGRHTLRVDALGGKNQSAWWDMIHFIPVDQNQIWPRFDVAGNAIYPGALCEEIAPYDQLCIGDLNN